MSEPRSEYFEKMRALQPAIAAAHERANRKARLAHARMGESVCEARDGKVVWLTPEEIFASYGLDQFGRPLQETEEPKEQ